LYANLAVTAACLFDYFVQGRDWALETLALCVVVLNGGVLLMRHFEIKAARKRDIEDEQHALALEAQHEARMRERGFR
jgi:hypothetical protein